VKEKITEAGVLYNLDIQGKKYYLFSSKKGSYRGGKCRNVSKTWTVLEGNVTSITHEDGKDKEEICTEGSVQTVKENIPHLLYFNEDSVVIEWWSGEYAEEKFEPFYNRKDTKKHA